MKIVPLTPVHHTARRRLDAADADGVPTLRVVVIDDDPGDRGIIRRHLGRSSHCHYVFREAATGAQGLALCSDENEPPDCVVLDLGLPDVDGLALIESLKRGAAELPFPLVVLTMSEGDEDEARLALALGAQDYLGKSWVTAESLSRAVDNAVERFHLTRQVRESEHRLRLALEAASIGMWEWDLRTNVVGWSPECYTIHGMQEGEFDGTAAGFDSLLHPDDCERVWSAVRTAAERRTRYDCEFRIVRPDGETRWVSNTGRALYDDEGVALRMIGTIADITERKQAEADLRRSEAEARTREAELETLMDAMPAAVLIARDPKCERMTANRTGRLWLGLPERGNASQSAPPDERPPFEVWSEGRLMPADELPMQRAAATGQPTSGTVCELVFADGRRLDLLGSALPLFDESGASRGSVGVFLDITRRKRRERDLAFLSELFRDLAMHPSSEEIMRVAAASIARYMGLAHCLLIEIDEAEGTASVLHDHHTPDRPALVGVYRIDDFHTAEERRVMAAGETLVINDVRAYPRSRDSAALFAAMGIRSIVNAGYRADGRWKFLLSAPRGEPCEWSIEDTELVSELAARLYLRVERARSDEILRASEERWRFALEVSEFGAWEMNLADLTIWRTARHDRIFGYESLRPMWAYDNTLEHVLAEDRPAFDRSFRAAVAERRDWSFECRTRRTDGEIRWVFVQGKHVPVTSGHAARMFGVLADITGRKQVESALNRNAALFSKIIEQAPGGVLVVDARFRIQQVNAEALPVFGGIDPLLGRDFSEVLEILWGAEVGRRVAAIFLRTLETGERYVSPPFSERRQDLDEEQSFEWETQRITLPDGQHGLVCYFKNVTDRVRREQALHDADRRKDEFLATLSHELRNPLAPVRNAVEILRIRGAGIADVDRARGIIDRQVRQMSRLIDDLLDVSRISRGKMELKRERIELADAVELAIETSRPMIEELGHELRVTLPPEPVVLDGDLTRLAQVFMNLLTNAAKYSDPGGRIGLTAERKADEVVICVTDSGIGLAADKLESVFEMFSQVEGALLRSRGGIGIGLALVKRLVEMHGGTVEADSPGANEGCTFTVRLPLPVGAPVVISEPDPETARLPVSRLRILVADDNRDAADSLAMLLEMMGNEVCTVHEGADAVREAERFLPQVALLDIGMPGMNGYEVARHIRSQSWGRDITLIAVTGWGEDSDNERSRNEGFDRHLVKPVDPESLLAVLAARGRIGS